MLKSSKMLTTDPGMHVFLDATGVYTIPLLRFSGIYTPSNGEFSTRPLTLGARGLRGLWINAAAGWRLVLSRRITPAWGWAPGIAST